MNTNQIILIDDDLEDTNLFTEACRSLNVLNEVVVFTNAEKVFEYISHLQNPAFFIMCDVNMRTDNGTELRNKIASDKRLSQSAIPFLLWSTLGSEMLADKAFMLNIQGFFKKPDSFTGLTCMINGIIQYWNLSSRPVV